LLNDVLADSLPETLLDMGLTGMKRDMGYDEEVTPVAAAPLQTDSDTPSTVQ
jgi:hypothetical protein